MHRTPGAVISSALVMWLGIAPSAQAVILNEPDFSGVIRSMTLPAGWIQVAEEPSHCGCGGVPRVRTLHPRGQAGTVHFIILSPGHRTSSEFSSALREILAAPPHDLDADEKQRLILKNYVTVGEHMRTMDLNGKRVYAFEQTIEPGIRRLTLQIDRHDRSRDDDVIVELWFQAPADLYARYLPAVNKMIASIAWRR